MRFANTSRPFASTFGPASHPSERWTYIWPFVLPEIYRTLVLERGWTPDQYEDWLTDQLEAQLLGG